MPDHHNVKLIEMRINTTNNKANVNSQSHYKLIWSKYTSKLSLIDFVKVTKFSFGALYSQAEKLLFIRLYKIWMPILNANLT